MKKVLFVILALFARPVESKESQKESEKQFCQVKVSKITPAYFGQDTGKIKFCVDGNTAPYKAVLKSATGSSFKARKITDIPHEATLEFECLPPDTYNLSLTSTCCSKCLTDIVVPELSQIVTTIDTIAAACFGEENGTISFTVTGGREPYRARLLNSHAEVVERISDIQAGVITTFTNLPADTYTLVMTDSFGYKERLNDIVVSQASEIFVNELTITPAYLTFATGSISFNVTGGTPYYTTELFNSTSSVPVQTAIDIDEGATTIFADLPPDTYSIVITDSNGCIVTDPGVVVPSSPVLVKVVEPVTPACFGENNGTIAFAPSGGVAPYTAYLFILVNNTPVEVQMIEGINEGETQVFKDLTSGTYIICAVDSEPLTPHTGCISNIVVIGLSQIVISLGQETPTPPGASTGTIPFTVSGSEAPYTVQLFNSTSSLALQTITIAQSGGTGTFTGLVAGTYRIVVTDANGCTATDPNITVSNSLEAYIRGKYC